MAAETYYARHNIYSALYQDQIIPEPYVIETYLVPNFSVSIGEVKFKKSPSRSKNLLKDVRLPT